MMYRFFLTFLMPLCQMASEAGELLKNGDFEKRFQGWAYPDYDGKPEPGMIDTEACGGNFCYRMGRENDGENRIEQRFAIGKGRDLVIRLFLKCSGVPAGDFQLRLMLWTNNTPNGFVFNPPGSGNQQLLVAGGTFSWREYLIVIPAAAFPPESESCSLFLERRQNGIGTVWIDEMSIRSVTPGSVAPRGEPVAVEVQAAPASPVAVPENRNGNLLPFDTSFESGPYFFQGTPDSSEAWHGSSSLRWDPDLRMRQGYLFRLIGLRKPYVFSFYFKSDRNDGNLKLLLMDQEYGTLVSREMPLSTKWQRMVVMIPPQNRIVSFVPFLTRSTDDAVVWLDGFQLHEGDIPAEYVPEAALAVGLVDPDAPGGIFEASPEPLKRIISVTNYRAEPEIRLTARLEAPDRPAVTLLEKTVSCPRRKSVREEITLLPETKPGYYLLRLTAEGGTGVKRVTEIPFVVATPLKKDDRFFGTHPGYADSPAGRRRSGSSTYRNFLFWKYTGKGPDGKYVVLPIPKGTRGDFEEVFTTLQTAPSPASLKADGTPDYEDCIAFLCDALKAGEAVAPGRCFEITNEPDLEFPSLFGGNLERGADEYAKLLNRAVPAMKAVQPEITIGIGGVSGVDFNHGFPFLTRVLEQLEFRLELIAVHPYCDARFISEDASDVGPELIDVYGRTEQLKQLLRKRGLTPELWFGEIGWALDVEADPLSAPARRQGAYTARLLLLARALDIHRVYWFMSDNHIEKERFYYGVWRNGAPLPAVAAYATVARLLSGAVPDETIQNGDVQMFTFRRPDGKLVGAVWMPAGEPGRFILGGKVRDLELYDMFGREVDPAKLVVNAEPLYLIGGDDLKVALKNAEIDLPPLAVEWKIISDREVAVRLTNRKKAALTGSVRLGGAVFEQAEQRISLTPDEECELRFRSGESLSLRTLQLELESPQGRQTQEFRMEILASPGKLPAMTDRTWLLPNDPGNGYAGASDLSVSGSFRHDAEYFHLELDVVDDVHHQTGDVSQLWAGDSVQIAFDAGADAAKGCFAYDRNDYEFSFALGPDGAVCRLEYAYERGRSAEIERSLRYRIDREGNVTRYRIAIPWKALGLNGVPGTLFGFNFVVNDSDGHGRRFWMGLTPGIADGKNPYAYRKIFLSR